MIIWGALYLCGSHQPTLASSCRNDAPCPAGATAANGPNNEPASSVAERERLIEIELQRLGPNRRADAERIVTMRMRADAARLKTHVVIIPKAQWQEEERMRQEALKAERLAQQRETVRREASYRANLLAEQRDRIRREDNVIAARNSTPISNPLFLPSPSFSVPSSQSQPGMGGVTSVEAPRYTAAQQAQADELERFKMAEQSRRGERPTSFADDARASLGANSNGASSNSTASSQLPRGSTKRDTFKAENESARVAARPLRILLSVVPAVGDKDKTQPVCVSNVLDLGQVANWPDANGSYQDSVAYEAARPLFASFLALCRNSRGDTRTASPATVSVYSNAYSGTDLDDERNKIINSHTPNARTLVTM